MSHAALPNGGVVGLREAFDRSFAILPARPAEGLRNFVGICLNTKRYAIALEEVAGIVPVTKIVALPSSAESLLGLMGLHGEAVCVHSIERLLGMKHHAEPRWLLISAADRSLGFAFEQLGGYLRLGEDAVRSLDDRSRGAQVGAVAVDGTRRVPIISIGAFLESTNGQLEQRSIDRD